ncbi:MAG: hypothetical protein ABIL09_05280 [Gemmatimonadota bacterium]
MTTQEFVERLRALGAPSDMVEWMEEQAMPGEEWRRCRQGDRMAWLAGRLGLVERIRPALYGAASRACREYAPVALEHVGLTVEANRLRALRPVTGVESAQTAAAIATSSAQAVARAGGAAGVAAAIWAAAAAADVAAVRSTSAATLANMAWIVARSAAAVAWEASWSAAADAARSTADAAYASELARSAREIRALLPWREVAQVLEEVTP